MHHGTSFPFCPCRLCKNPQRRQQRQGWSIGAGDDYMRQVVNGDQAQTQILSLLDVGIDIQQHMNSMIRGSMRSGSLITQALVQWGMAPLQAAAVGAAADAAAAGAGGDPTPAAPAAPNGDPAAAPAPNVPARIQALLQFNLANNPLFSAYLSLLERPLATHLGAAILTSDVIRQIMEWARLKGPLADVQEAAAHAGLGIIMDARPDTFQQRAIFCSAGLVPRQADEPPGGPHSPAASRGPRLPDRVLITRTDGTPIAGTGGPQKISVEAGLMPFLFPFGRGYFRWLRKGPALATYLRYRMSCPFTIFTLYAPYLLYMHAIRQQHTIAGSIKEEVLHADLHRQRQRQPDASDADLLRDIIKFKLPSTIANSPAYFRSNLRDLLCMVEHKGMPSLFLTLTQDEVSETRWTEIDDLEQCLNRYLLAELCAYLQLVLLATQHTARFAS
jgi:hypothetical protein